MSISKPKCYYRQGIALYFNKMYSIYNVQNYNFFFTCFEEKIDPWRTKLI